MKRAFPKWYFEQRKEAEENLKKEAIRLGADFLVLGRPITESQNPLETIKKINKSIQ